MREIERKRRQRLVVVVQLQSANQTQMQLRPAAARRLPPGDQRTLGQVQWTRHRNDHHQNGQVSRFTNLIVPPTMSDCNGQKNKRIDWLDSDQQEKSSLATSFPPQMKPVRGGFKLHSRDSSLLSSLTRFYTCRRRWAFFPPDSRK